MFFSCIVLMLLQPLISIYKRGQCLGVLPRFLWWNNEVQSPMSQKKQSFEQVRCEITQECQSVSESVSYHVFASMKTVCQQHFFLKRLHVQHCSWPRSERCARYMSCFSEDVLRLQFNTAAALNYVSHKPWDCFWACRMHCHESAFINKAHVFSLFLEFLGETMGCQVPCLKKCIVSHRCVGS